MKRMGLPFTLVAVAATAFAATVGTPSAGAAEKARYVPGEVIVKFRSGVVLGGMQTAARSAHPMAAIAKVSAARPSLALARFPKSASVPDLVARFRAMPGVEYAEPNYIASIPAQRTVLRPPDVIRRRIGKVSEGRTQTVLASQIRAAFTVPNDPSIGSQWGWSWIDAPTIAPDPSINPMVAVLDTGVDYMHPELSLKTLKGKDFINDDLDPMDDNGHGTHVAGIIGAKIGNAKGIAGVAKSNIYAVKVLDATGSGGIFDIALGIDLAANNAAVKVINMSLGYYPSPDPVSTTLQTAVDNAVNVKGKLIVAAAGNDGLDLDVSGNEFYPASFANATNYPTLTGKVLAVAADGNTFYGSFAGGAVFVEQCRASYSNYGATVSISAPGTAIYSTTPYNRDFYLLEQGETTSNYGELDGTSQAAPHVAGSAARVFSIHSTYTNAQVAAALTGSGVLQVAGGTVDVDGDTVDDGTCWPASNNATMNDLNVAMAMGRGRIFGRAMDATTSLTLTGGKVTAYQGLLAKGTGGDVKPFDGGGFYDIVNVPYNATAYTLKVLKAAYTLGAQAFTTVPIDVNNPSTIAEDISVPLIKPYVFVTNWSSPLGITSVDLDQYLWLPGPTNGCIVPFGPCAASLADYQGSLGVFPFARWLHDGGPWDIPTETTAIKTLGTGTYSVFVTDYGDGTNLALESPVARLWKAGAIKATVRLSDGTADATCIPISGSTSPCPWWHVGTLSAGVFTPANTLGDGATIGDPLPYGPSHGRMSVAKQH